MNSQNVEIQISHYLNLLANDISINNASGKTDINSHLEDLICRLLNKIYGIELENVNRTDRFNYPAIDLRCSRTKIAYQVTSEDSKNKIETTLQKFVTHGLANNFSLNFLIAKSKKPKSTRKYIVPKETSFDPTAAIKYFPDILKDIAAISQLDIKKEILTILKQEYEPLEKANSQPIVREIETLGDLISYLTENSEVEGALLNDAEPDPQGKIEKRFAAHANFLKKAYCQLAPTYAYPLSIIEESLELDIVKVQKLRIHLQIKSNLILSESNNNPEKALDSLTESYSSMIKESGKNHDYLAIRFYLIKELIRCNVFPNTDIS